MIIHSILLHSKFENIYFFYFYFFALYDCIISRENNKIKVWNNGRGIPVIEHKTEKMYVPTMIFGHLLTSSNYDDSQKKVTGTELISYMQDFFFTV